MATRGSKGSGGSSRKKGVSFVKGEATRKTRAPKKTVRAAKSRASTSRSVVKPTAAKAKKASAAKRSAQPSWKDLVTDNDRKKSLQQESETYLGALSTTRFAVVVLSVATLFTLYIGHVLTTQDLLKEVQELRGHNENLELRLNQYQGEEDELVGYAQIVERARELGLEDRVPEGNQIVVRR